MEGRNWYKTGLKRAQKKEAQRNDWKNVEMDSVRYVNGQQAEYSQRQQWENINAWKAKVDDVTGGLQELMPMKQAMVDDTWQMLYRDNKISNKEREERFERMDACQQNGIDAAKELQKDTFRIKEGENRETRENRLLGVSMADSQMDMERRYQHYEELLGEFKEIPEDALQLPKKEKALVEHFRKYGEMLQRGASLGQLIDDMRKDDFPLTEREEAQLRTVGILAKDTWSMLQSRMECMSNVFHGILSEKEQKKLKSAIKKADSDETLPEEWKNLAQNNPEFAKYLESMKKVVKQENGEDTKLKLDQRIRVARSQAAMAVMEKPLVTRRLTAKERIQIVQPRLAEHEEAGKFVGNVNKLFTGNVEKDCEKWAEEEAETRRKKARESGASEEEIAQIEVRQVDRHVYIMLDNSGNEEAERKNKARLTAYYSESQEERYKEYAKLIEEFKAFPDEALVLPRKPKEILQFAEKYYRMLKLAVEAHNIMDEMKKDGYMLDDKADTKLRGRIGAFMNVSTMLSTHLKIMATYSYCMEPETEALRRKILRLDKDDAFTRKKGSSIDYNIYVSNLELLYREELKAEKSVAPRVYELEPSAEETDMKKTEEERKAAAEKRKADEKKVAEQRVADNVEKIRQTKLDNQMREAGYKPNCRWVGNGSFAYGSKEVSRLDIRNGKAIRVTSRKFNPAFKFLGLKELTQEQLTDRLEQQSAYENVCVKAEELMFGQFKQDRHIDELMEKSGDKAENMPATVQMIRAMMRGAESEEVREEMAGVTKELPDMKTIDRNIMYDNILDRIEEQLDTVKLEELKRGNDEEILETYSKYKNVFAIGSNLEDWLAEITKDGYEIEPGRLEKLKAMGRLLAMYNDYIGGRVSELSSTLFGLITEEETAQVCVDNSFLTKPEKISAMEQAPYKGNVDDVPAFVDGAYRRINAKKLLKDNPQADYDACLEQVRAEKQKEKKDQQEEKKDQQEEKKDQQEEKKDQQENRTGENT